jgi:hypothetical protein
MNLELGPILDVFPNASKDARRIGLFVTACQKKAIELVMSNGDYKGFAEEAFAIAMKFSPKKLSFASLFGDPYKGARQDAREFGKKWQLDPLFLKEMG